MLKFTLNGKWFKSEDEMTSLEEYNFEQNTSLNLCHTRMRA